MIRAVIIGLFVFFALPALAQPGACLDPSQSWSWSYSVGPISSINYYLDSQVLAVAYNDGVEHLLNGVPTNVAQRFQIGYGVSPASIWAGMRYGYLEILQSQVHCPLRSQSGEFLLSAAQHDTPQ
jgi:hypothetical protein